MAFCLKCDAEKHPVSTFTAKGIVEACPTCESVFARVDPAAPPPPVAQAPQAVVASLPATRAPSVAAVDVLSIVGMARARLAVVEAEIAARDGYIAEREQLRKILAAVEPEVAPIPATVQPN